jgi:Fic family protein
MFPAGPDATAAGQAVAAERGRWAFVPNAPPWPVEYSGELVSLLGEASAAIAGLAATAEALPGAHLLTAPAVRIEAVSSSRIEGTRLSLEDLLRNESDPVAPAPSGDAREVVNCVEAMDWGLRNVEEITPRFIEALHGVLMRAVRGAAYSPGQLRAVQVYITSGRGTLHYIPPPPAEVPRLVETLCAYLGSSESSTPELIRIALAHWFFEATHPFTDGNGRIGRLLITLSLCRRGLLPAPVLYLSPYIDAHRPEYYDRLLAVSRDGDFTGWIAFMLHSFEVQALAATAMIRRVTAVRDEMRETVRGQSRSTNLLALLDMLFANPFVSAPRAAKLMGVSDQTVRNLLATLLDLGLLEQFGERRRNRVFYAPRLLRMLEEAARSGDAIGTSLP